MTVHCSTSRPFVSTTEAVKEAMGLNRYDEHCLGYRWHLYVRDSNREAQLRALMAEVRKPLGFIR